MKQCCNLFRSDSDIAGCVVTHTDHGALVRSIPVLVEAGGLDEVLLIILNCLVIQQGKNWRDLLHVKYASSLSIHSWPHNLSLFKSRYE